MLGYILGQQANSFQGTSSTPKQQEIKFRPMIKLSHDIYVQKKGGKFNSLLMDT